MKNFGWIGTWAVTRRCNLDCTYCSPKRLPVNEPEPVDYDLAIDRIGRIAPKVLNLSGGEPSLVPDLPRILEKIKQRWNPFIRIVNNGTRAHHLVGSLPWFDRLVVSLDGPGEVNAATRGISGDHVLREIRRFLDGARDAGRDLPEVVINNVITAANVSHLRRMCEAVAEVDPTVAVAVSPLVPTGHPLAIHRHPELWTEFWKTYEELRAEGFPLWHHFEFFLSPEPVTAVRCFNQFFVVRFWPDGTAGSCKPEPGLTVQNAGSYLSRLWKEPKLLPRALRQGTRLLAEVLRPGVDPACENPCNCEAWLDVFFQGGEHANLEYYFRPLWGRFERDEIERVYQFVRKNINREFSREKLTPLLKEE